MAENVDKKAQKLLLIGGSAGSLEVILAMLPRIVLGEHLAIVIILHRKGGDASMVLVSLIKDRSFAPVKEAEEKEIIAGGHIYIAPGDYHLLIEKNKTFSLDFSEKIHFSRPSIDVSFQTGAEAFGEATVGVLLSGASKDGTEGLQAINNAGGISVVQTPDSSVVDFMPANAIRYASPKEMLNVTELIDYINGL
jgi:two-component system chemotaxis response regulator CheB